RAHRRARVRARRLLLDGDRGGQAADGVVEGLVHLPEELPRVRVEALDVAALTLRVEGVEGERRLARTRDPGQDQYPSPSAGCCDTKILLTVSVLKELYTTVLRSSSGSGALAVQGKRKQSSRPSRGNKYELHFKLHC